MPVVDEVSDSTDWLGTPLSGLGPLESGLRCQVCKDFFSTPMITSCSHTFCSICIRRYLSQEGKCPACRESDQENKLRRNWAIEELVAQFTSSRPQILEFARRPPAQSQVAERPRKRRKLEGAAESVDRRSTRSQSRRVAASASQTSQNPSSTQEEVADSEDEGSLYEDEKGGQASDTKTNGEPNDGLVACPCCSRRMKEASINSHLDRCIAGLPTSPERQTQSKTESHPLPFAQKTKSPAVVAAQDRLPSINYALYTETSLRKKLKELGIPNHGNKELMKKRHIEWMNLWNANCDSSKPKSKRDLLRGLDTWERTLGRQIDKGPNGAASGVAAKDFDRDGWVKNNHSDYDDLIKIARAKRRNALAQRDDAPKTDAGPVDANRTVDVDERSVMQAASLRDPETQDIPMDDQSPLRNCIETSTDTPDPGNIPPALSQINNHVLNVVPETPDKTGTIPSVDLTLSPVNGTEKINGVAL